MGIEKYAQVMAELASSGESPASRAEVLARHALDEGTWEAIDTRWQEKLSDALDLDDDGLPPILSTYIAAYQAAQRPLAPPITLDQFALVTRHLSASGDVRASLAKVGVSLADYVRGSEHWSRRLAEDPELERRFQELVMRGKA